MDQELKNQYPLTSGACHSPVLPDFRKLYSLTL